MARVVHIAVKLLLIVAMTLQPVMACVGKCCGRVGCGSETECTGCACCQVHEEAEKCTCCRKRPAEPRPLHACCRCSSEGPLPVNGAKSESDEPVGELTVDDGRSLDPNPASHGMKSQRAVYSIGPNACHCRCSSEKYAVPLTRSMQLELLDLMVMDLHVCLDNELTAKPSTSLPVKGTQSVRLPHFSQISYCVWHL